MNDIIQLMSEIENRKENIARAIAKAFADGDERKTSEYFPIFYEKIKNNKVYIFKSFKEKEVPHDKVVDELLFKISSILNSDVSKKYYDGRFVIEDNSDYDGVDEKTLIKLQKLYNSSKKMFLKLRITEKMFFDFYRYKGMKETVNLSKFVNKLKVRDSQLQQGKRLENRINLGYFLFYSKMFSEFSDKYNVTSFDDVMAFYSEVCSCLLKEKGLSNEELQLVEENRKKINNRLVNSKTSISRYSLKKIKSKIEEIYSNEFLRKSFEESNLKEFFDISGIAVSKNNVDKLLLLYRAVYGALAINADIEFDEGLYNLSVFKESALNRGNNTLNEIVIHETIHSLESNTYNNNLWPMNSKYSYYLNEAITQHLTLKAFNYMDGYILGIGNDDFNLAYNYMLPALDVLVNSSLWNDLLCSKLDNNYYYMVAKIGDYAKNIAKIFNNLHACSTMITEEKNKILNDAIEELKQIVFEVDNKTEIINKRKSF